jgi:hypothetical protein
VATTASVTYNTKSLIKQLEATRDRMKKEIAEWEEASDKLPAKRKAWEKKARAWFKKNAGSLINDESNLNVYNYNRSSVRLDINVDMKSLTEAIGEYPDGDSNSRPSYDGTRFNQKVSPLDEVENAIAMFKGCMDTDIKVSMKSTFFQYLR